MALPQAIKAGLPCMNLLRMTAVPILEQLYLEERLLRTSAENWCIINHGTSLPTIVMGISGYVFTVPIFLISLANLPLTWL